jgi:hypothetical protein
MLNSKLSSILSIIQLGNWYNPFRDTAADIK